MQKYQKERDNSMKLVNEKEDIQVALAEAVDNAGQLLREKDKVSVALEATKRQLSSLVTASKD